MSFGRVEKEIAKEFNVENEITSSVSLPLEDPVSALLIGFRDDERSDKVTKVEIYQSTSVSLLTKKTITAEEMVPKYYTHRGASRLDKYYRQPIIEENNSIISLAHAISNNHRISQVYAGWGYESNAAEYQEHCREIKRFIQTKNINSFDSSVLMAALIENASERIYGDKEQSSYNRKEQILACIKDIKPILACSARYELLDENQDVANDNQQNNNIFTASLQKAGEGVTEAVGGLTKIALGPFVASQNKNACF